MGSLAIQFLSHTKPYKKSRFYLWPSFIEAVISVIKGVIVYS